jgi:hypothetical protein
MATPAKIYKHRETALITDAVDVLVKNLGPEKTMRLWNVLVPQKGDYLKIRPKLFANKSDAALYKEIRKFNRR